MTTVASAPEAKPRPTAEEIKAKVVGAWSWALPTGQLAGAFFDQGGTSLSAVLFVARLEDELGVTVPFTVLVTVQGADGIVDWINAGGAPGTPQALPAQAGAPPP